MKQMISELKHSVIRVLDQSERVWQQRALRYLAIYSVLVLLLVTTRVLTYQIRPELRQIQALETKLLTEKDKLEIEVQVATTPQRIDQWALENGMKPFAVSEKKQSYTAPEALKEPSFPTTEVTLKTQWR